MKHFFFWINKIKLIFIVCKNNIINFWTTCVYSCAGDQLQPIVEKLTTRNAVFTVIADSCHSGGLLRKAYEQIGYSVIDQGVMEP
jgi:hypothetical protein